MTFDEWWESRTGCGGEHHPHTKEGAQAAWNAARQAMQPVEILAGKLVVTPFDAEIEQLKMNVVADLTKDANYREWVELRVSHLEADRQLRITRNTK